MTYRATIFDLFDTLLYTSEIGTRETAIQLAMQVGITTDQWQRGSGDLLTWFPSQAAPSALDPIP